MTRGSTSPCTGRRRAAIEDTLANTQSQSETAQKFCAEQAKAGLDFFGCPVQYDASGALPLGAR